MGAFPYLQYILSGKFSKNDCWFGRIWFDLPVVHLVWQVFIELVEKKAKVEGARRVKKTLTFSAEKRTSNRDCSPKRITGRCHGGASCSTCFHSTIVGSVGEKAKVLENYVDFSAHLCHNILVPLINSRQIFSQTYVRNILKITGA